MAKQTLETADQPVYSSGGADYGVTLWNKPSNPLIPDATIGAVPIQTSMPVLYGAPGSVPQQPPLPCQASGGCPVTGGAVTFGPPPALPSAGEVKGAPVGASLVVSEKPTGLSALPWWFWLLVGALAIQVLRGRE